MEEEQFLKVLGRGGEKYRCSTVPTLYSVESLLQVSVKDDSKPRLSALQDQGQD